MNSVISFSLRTILGPTYTTSWRNITLREVDHRLRWSLDFRNLRVIQLLECNTGLLYGGINKINNNNNNNNMTHHPHISKSSSNNS